MFLEPGTILLFTIFLHRIVYQLKLSSNLSEEWLDGKISGERISVPVVTEHTIPVTVAG